MRVNARMCDNYLRRMPTNKSFCRRCLQDSTNEARCIRVVRTFQPKKRQRSKVHGFRKRMKSADGRNVIKRRRAKGRKVLSA